MTPNLPLSHSPSRRLASLFGAALVLYCLLAAFFWTLGQDAAQAAPAVGPDLTVEISLDPPVPADGQEVKITFVVRNKGASTTGSGFTAYLYVDPADRPPTLATLGRPFGFATLAAGASAQAERTQTISGKGCNHVIYVWVDRDNQIAEDNEENNLIALPFCVGVECEVDSHENDNQCSAANWLLEGAAEARSFCHPTDRNLTDEDWIKFTALTEVTYTLATSNLGQHAAPQIALRSACGGAEIASGLTTLAWQPPVAGVYYARIQNSDGLQGPLTAYSLTLTSATGLTDNFEPDDTCATAREIPTDGTKQSRLFQAPGDTDWLRFTTKAGESFAVVSSGTGTGVNPVITLYSSCNQARSSASIAQNTQRVEASSPGDQVYYARVANQNPNRFGSSATYDMQVLASSCVSDDQEEDDSFAQARAIDVGGTAKTHNFCPAGDQDWVKFTVTSTQVYVLNTSNLGFASDTVLTLYDSQGNQLATNDDYDYVRASRIVFEPSTNGDYYAMVRHRNPEAAGPNTNYDLSIETGFCALDGGDGGNGDNGPADATFLAANSAPLPRNFCADPLSGALGDQDWLRFPATAGGVYRISTGSLGLNSDTVLRLYDRDGKTLLGTNDDNGAGRSATIVFTPTVSGDYFVQVTQFNSNVFGQESSYTVELQENIPPTPTPTATPTPSPTPTPTPLPTVDPSGVRTLILTNRQRLESLYGPIETGGVMAKLFELADHEKVEGAVVLVENNAAVAAAYAAWTANANSLADNALANSVADAIRGLVLSLFANGPNIEYLVIAGDDRVIPFRRIGEGNLTQLESSYAQELGSTSTVAAALAQDKILTDDYYTDKEPSQWKGNELYIPDYASSRLIETPTEIIGVIDTFLAGQETNLQKALVIGWDFVEDSANIISLLTSNDTIATDKLLGNLWTDQHLRPWHLAANPRYDFQSINSHSTHTATLVPIGQDITAADIAAAVSDLSRAIIFAVGCHSGLNDPNTLDLPQAFLQKRANYVGNTGFGWGGGGVVYSEAVMRNYARELLRDTRAAIGPALVAAKQKYYTSAFVFGAYDAKSLMQVTLYGLPMYEVTSGGTLADGDPFPSAEESFAPPTSFGDLNVGTFSYSLAGNFGDNDSPDGHGSFNDLDGNVSFSAGTPIQPNYYADVTAPTAG
ncbi:MAG: pre-peptidase C-terminal domain-containing protein, partial [Chloroflexi bacterium]|nr:pre-peptidase C-terminal domain-containing protein [Chloroflexota bacterium]